MHARLTILLLLGLFLAGISAPARAVQGQVRLLFSGGPEGGTFQYFSNGITSRLNNSYPNFQVINQSSAGSVENLRRVNAASSDFGIVYAGDAYLARHGHLSNDPQRYENIFALARLYGAPAHLLTRAGSDIQMVFDLVGKRIAVGGVGSGAAASAERYLTALGLWSKVEVQFIGYSKAATELQKGTIDALWILAGFPNAAIMQATTGQHQMRLVDTWTAGEQAGFFKRNPYYKKVTIPGGTYNGITSDCVTFEDSAIWVAGKQVREELVHQSLADIFSEDGLAYMVKVKSTARAMGPPSAVTDLPIPLHEGAIGYWAERGAAVPSPPGTTGR